MAYTGNSIVDYLKSEGKDSSYSARKILAQQYGITNYSGTAAQNTQLLNAMRNGQKTPVQTVAPTVQNVGSTNLSAYTPSAATNQKKTIADNAASAVANYGAYQSNYTDQLNSLYDQIINQKPFSYDLNGDMLYQQYKDQYQVLGKQAMMDTIGQAAALTGGYGNSYATTAGNQAYQGYLQQLNSVVPQLYQIALDKYNADRSDLYNRANLTASLDDRDYGRWQDAYNRLVAEREYANNDYNNERNFDYGQFTDARDYQTALDQWNQEMAYQKERDRIADEQWAKEYALSVAAQKKSRSRGGGNAGGKSGGNTGKGNNIEFSDSEVLALGYGPISDSTLENLITSGAVEVYVENGNYHLKRKQSTGNSAQGAIKQQNKQTIGGLPALGVGALK